MNGPVAADLSLNFSAIIPQLLGDGKPRLPPQTAIEVGRSNVTQDNDGPIDGKSALLFPVLAKWAPTRVARGSTVPADAPLDSARKENHEPRSNQTG